MSAATKSGLSPLAWRNHAVDERANHPSGMYRAQCGHLLMGVTYLFEEPTGKSCEGCAAGRSAGGDLWRALQGELR